MKKILFLLFASCMAISCSGSKSISVKVSNTSSLDRAKEMVEVSMNDINAKLSLSKTDQVVVLDKYNQQLPYQVTYDGNLVFPTTVKANSSEDYTIKIGSPNTFNTITCGKQYPERLDDVAWENDRIAFRTYGPALQATGEKAFGFDIWVKRCEQPVVEARYAKELDKNTVEKIKSLEKTDPAAAKALREASTYHVDHGNGLDFYKVGPTLGAGTSAFLIDSTLVYPYCYAKQEVLDNGPLRFTVKLTYNPITIKGDSSVVETRIISLDAGSQMNKIAVSYSKIKEILPLATGIVIHKGSNDYAMSASKGYIAYADPKDPVNGQIYVGAVFPANVKETKVQLFKGAEATKIKDGANGHVMAISDYEAGSEFIYYFGAGWSKWGFKSSADWFKYVDEFAQKARSPLSVTIK